MPFEATIPVQQLARKRTVRGLRDRPHKGLDARRRGLTRQHAMANSAGGESEGPYWVRIFNAGLLASQERAAGLPHLFTVNGVLNLDRDLVIYEWETRAWAVATGAATSVR